MSKDVFDDDLHNLYADEDKVNECTECGKPIEHEGVCSQACYKASML